jgi:hypothetical protein
VWWAPTAVLMLMCGGSLAVGSTIMHGGSQHTGSALDGGLDVRCSTFGGACNGWPQTTMAWGWRIQDLEASVLLCSGGEVRPASATDQIWGMASGLWFAFPASVASGHHGGGLVVVESPSFLVHALFWSFSRQIWQTSWWRHDVSLHPSRWHFLVKCFDPQRALASFLWRGEQGPFGVVVWRASVVGAPNVHHGLVTDITLVVWWSLGVSSLHGRGRVMEKVLVPLVFVILCMVIIRIAS